MNNALLIIDIQNDYFPGGKMELSGSVEAGNKAAALLESFRKKGLPVIHIRHISAYPGSTFFLPGTEGAEIHNCAAPQEGEPVFEKYYPNSFRGTPLLQYLQDHGITKLCIAGMMTHMCVDTTVRAAFDLGFECTLAHDACATRDLSFGGTVVPACQVHLSYIAALNGLFARVLPADEIIPLTE
jgi:nicotinamidase-related amidase